MDPLTMMLIGQGVGMLGSGLAAKFGGTQQVAGPTFAQMQQAIEASRRSGMMGIAADRQRTMSAIGSQTASSGMLDSGAAAGIASRAVGESSRATAQLEGGLAQAFISGLSAQQWASVPTGLSAMAQALAASGGPLTNMGMLNLWANLQGLNTAKPGGGAPGGLAFGQQGVGQLGFMNQTMGQQPQFPLTNGINYGNQSVYGR